MEIFAIVISAVALAVGATFGIIKLVKYFKRRKVFSTVSGKPLVPRKRTEEEVTYTYDTIEFTGEAYLIIGGTISSTKLDPPTDKIKYLVSGYDFVFEGKKRIPYFNILKYDIDHPAAPSTLTSVKVAYDEEMKATFETITIK